MSVSLVTFRLEVGDASKEPSSFRFAACGLRDFDSDFAKTYTALDEASLLDIQRRCFGRRQYRSYAIETHDFMEAQEDVRTATGVGDDAGGVACAELPANCDSSTSDTGKEKCHALVSPSQDDYKRPSSTGRHAAPKLPGGIHFLCGNPTVELTEGILHLYKESKRSSVHGDVQRSELICMVAVPAALTLHDLLQFTDQVYPGIEYIKIIRDQTPGNLYMTLVKFRSQKLADDFYNNYNGKPFNSIEPYVCHLVYVAHVEFLKSSDGASLPVSGLVELPQCPVCLERMDESVDGILTILCNHSFHGYCLSKWGDSTCPVCRCCQTPEPAAESRCLSCGSLDSLWICLICGHVGCGRYVGGHANEHFRETAHTYAMQLSDRRVWDYVGDNYVHRLIQNKEDGKLVQFDDEASMRRMQCDGVACDDEKSEALVLEYTYLLTSQLESQRRYYEGRATRAEKEAQEREALLEARAARLAAELEQAQHDLEAARTGRTVLERRAARAEADAARLVSELKDEKQMGVGLQQNVHHWQEKANSLERELADVREQLRDVMFSLDASSALAGNSEVTADELRESKVELATPVTAKKRGSKKKR